MIYRVKRGIWIAYKWIWGFAIPGAAISLLAGLGLLTVPGLPKLVLLEVLQWLFLAGLHQSGTPPLTGERAQATFRGRPRGRFGSVGSGKGWMRGRPRGRFGSVGSDTEALPSRRTRLGSTQAGGATL